MLDALIEFYERELIYLRQLGKEFAARHPGRASMLALERDTSATPDPHVERLIQAFAFLTARIHRKLGDEFPEITDALLGVLYPHYLRPIPSMSIVQFQVAPEKAQMTGHYPVPRHTKLTTMRSVDGAPYYFRTCYPVDLWPIQVLEARIEPVETSGFSLGPSDVMAVLRIRMSCLGDVTFSKLISSKEPLQQLRFFLDAEGPLGQDIYELLCNNTRQALLTSGNTKLSLPGDSIRPVGFAPNEGMLEYGERSFLGYRLLQEYFAFPEKFLFIDITRLDAAMAFGKDMEIVVLLGKFERAERLQRLVQTVSANTFKLGCTPIVNLFMQQADPIRLTHQKSEYQVIPDARYAASMEVYSIDMVRNVVQTLRNKEDIIEFQPLYSFRHALNPEGQKTFWYAARRPSLRRGDAGTEVYLSLVDLALDPAVPAVETLSITTTCNNRDVKVDQIFGGDRGDLKMVDTGSAVISRIRCLRRPTPTLRPSLGHGAVWRLISHLSLNHLSIVEGGRDALLEVLNLYNFSDSAAVRKQIGRITRLQSQPSVVRAGTGQRSAFVRGTDVEIEFDEREDVGSGVYLMASVLEHFLGLYCALNSFTRLTVRTKQREEILAQWPPRTGDAILV